MCIHTKIYKGSPVIEYSTIFEGNTECGGKGIGEERDEEDDFQNPST